MYNCLVINEKDTVATVITPIKAGEEAVYFLKGSEHKVKAISDIIKFHKIALCDIKKGDTVIKYGCKIGYALCDIKKGEYVHTHNLDSKKQ
ncbi:MAG: UxaA family hydrolase [Clostridia bacterium]|jgi:altronate dehydratase|nr:UxaA family hydrolase [Clostridia bacterium]MCI1999109.1 UxaA family hydrolase [Clostridia bacterium]MCI2013859.1 UxaA family hydrolase [Clostridia bacterium]